MNESESQNQFSAIQEKWNLDDSQALVFWLIKELKKSKRKKLTPIFDKEQYIFFYDRMDSLFIWLILRKHPGYLQAYAKYMGSDDKTKVIKFQNPITANFFLKTPVDPACLLPENLEVLYEPFFMIARALPITFLDEEFSCDAITLNSFVNPALTEKAMTQFIYDHQSKNKIDKRKISQLLTYENLLQCLYVLYFQVKNLNSQNSKTVKAHFRELFNKDIKQEIQIIRINDNLSNLFQQIPTIFFS